MTDRRRPGRPPLDPNDPSVSVTISLPSKHLEALMTEAQQRRLPLREYVRKRLRWALVHRPPD